jgi:hypothetical protein
MQTRAMLYLEQGKALKLLSGIPRRWLEHGQQIQVENAASYFGPLSFTVKSKLQDGRMEAVVSCPSKRRPQAIELRLPHPQGQKAKAVAGGTYDPALETVQVKPFRGHATIVLTF